MYEPYYNTLLDIILKMKELIEALFPQYEYSESLGNGKFSATFKVKDKQLNLQLCVKVFYIQGMNEQNMDKLFDIYTRLQNIKNPNIIKIINSVYNNEKTHFIVVSEFIQGGNIFQDILKRIEYQKPYLESEIWDYLFQISNGLKALHDLKIIHTELKTQNIFLQNERQIKIGDIGIRYLISQNNINGCPFYKSPESFLGIQNKKSDIWSLGCLLYEMIYQKPLFLGNNLEELHKKIQKAQLPKMTSFNKNIIYLIENLVQSNQQERPEINIILQIVSLNIVLVLNQKTQIQIKYFFQINKKQNRLVNIIKLTKIIICPKQMRLRNQNPKLYTNNNILIANQIINTMSKLQS
ncbi:protein kinase domain protein, partial [Ichthyophthirius multifiliis]